MVDLVDCSFLESQQAAADIDLGQLTVEVGPFNPKACPSL